MNNLKKIKIQLNGKKYQIKLGQNLKDLLKTLKKDNNKVAIELNGEIADKKKYNNIFLKKNDKIEIVQFIGGGQNI